MESVSITHEIKIRRNWKWWAAKNIMYIGLFIMLFITAVSDHSSSLKYMQLFLVILMSIATLEQERIKFMINTDPERNKELPPFPQV